MRFAIIVEDVVQNIIVADQEFVDAQNYEAAINVDNTYCDIGSTHIGEGEFSPTFIEPRLEVVYAVCVDGEPACPVPE